MAVNNKAQLLHLSDLNQKEFYKSNQSGFSYQRSIVSVVGRDGVWPRGQTERGSSSHNSMFVRT